MSTMSCTSTSKPASFMCSIQTLQQPQLGVLWTAMRGRATGVASGVAWMTCAAGATADWAGSGGWVQPTRPPMARATHVRRLSLQTVIAGPCSALGPRGPVDVDDPPAVRDLLQHHCLGALDGQGLPVLLSVQLAFGSHPCKLAGGSCALTQQL